MVGRNLIPIFAIFALLLSASGNAFAKAGAGGGSTSGVDNSWSDCTPGLNGPEADFKKLMEKDPNAECAYNAMAATDKSVDLASVEADNDPQAKGTSLCRNAYDSFKRSVVRYQKIVETGCAEAKRKAEGCFGISDQKALTNCLADVKEMSAKTQGDAKKAMKRVQTKAAKYIDKIQEVKEKYRNDQVVAAKDDAVPTVGSNSVFSGWVSATVNAATDAKEKTETALYTKLIEEQDKAESTITVVEKAAANSYSFRERQEQQLTADAARLRADAAKYSPPKSESDITGGKEKATAKTPPPIPKEKPPGLGPPGTEKVTGTTPPPGGGKSTTPDPKAPDPKAGDTQTTGLKSPDSQDSSQGYQNDNKSNVSDSSSSGGGGGGGMSVPKMGGGDSGSDGGSEHALPVAPALVSNLPKKTTFDGDNSSEQPGPVMTQEQPKEKEVLKDGPGGPISPVAESFVSGNGDLPQLGNDKQNAAGRSVAAVGKVSGGGAAGMPKGSETPCIGVDCTALKEMKGSQFKNIGSLGGSPMPGMGGGGTELSSSALDALFGSGAEETHKGASLDALGVGGVMNALSSPGEHAEAEAFQSGALENEEGAVANTLWVRVKAVHERAQKRGAVSGPRKKL